MRLNFQQVLIRLRGLLAGLPGCRIAPGLRCGGFKQAARAGIGFAAGIIAALVKQTPAGSIPELIK